MQLRPGHTYRVYDSENVTIALDPESHGGGYSPEIGIYNRRFPYSHRLHQMHIKVPHITWAFAYKHRKWGMLPLYSLVQRAIYMTFLHPNVAERMKEARK